MNTKELFSTCKDLLFVFPRDEIAKRYLLTKSTKYQFVINYLDKKEIGSNYLINESLIQEFSFSNTPVSDDFKMIHNVTFSNISIGSTHIRDFHDFDLKLISKLSMLEFLARTNFGKMVFKDFKFMEGNSDYKKLNLMEILQKDKDFIGSEIKLPFSLAIIIDSVKQGALETEEIFRKSAKLAALQDFYKELYRLMTSDTNNIVEIYKFVQDIDPILLCAVLKKLLQNFSPLIPINVLKFLYSVSDINEPQLLVLLYQCLMLQIPDPERNLLETVLDLLALVVEKKDKNKLCLQSIATLFAPVLLNPDQEFITRAIDVLIQMIHYRKIIFLIPRNVLNIHRNDNLGNQKIPEPQKYIGKKSYLDLNNKSIVLCQFKHRVDDDFTHEEHIDKLIIDNVFTFKYKKRLLSLSYTDTTTTADAIKMAIKGENVTGFRLYEKGGNIHQSSLHPNMKLLQAINDNCTSHFFVDIAPEYDIVKSTLGSLYHFLKIPH